MPREEKRLLIGELLLLLLTRRCLEVMISTAKSPLIRLGVNSRKAYSQLKYCTLAHFSMKQLEDFLHDNQRIFLHISRP